MLESKIKNSIISEVNDLFNEAGCDIVSAVNLFDCILCSNMPDDYEDLGNGYPKSINIIFDPKACSENIFNIRNNFCNCEPMIKYLLLLSNAQVYDELIRKKDERGPKGAMEFMNKLGVPPLCKHEKFNDFNDDRINKKFQSQFYIAYNWRNTVSHKAPKPSNYKLWETIRGILIIILYAIHKNKAFIEKGLSDNLFLSVDFGLYIQNINNKHDIDYIKTKYVLQKI